MKRFFKPVLAALILLACAGTASAQKLGVVNTQEILQLMPEADSVRIKLAAFQKELEQTLEEMQVELNKKYDTYQKSRETMSTTERRNTEYDIQTLEQRLVMVRDSAQEDLQEEQLKLMKPMLEKINAVVARIAKQQGIVMVFNYAGSIMENIAYLDPAHVVDLTPAVKPELKITK